MNADAAREGGKGRGELQEQMDSRECWVQHVLGEVHPSHWDLEPYRKHPAMSISKHLIHFSVTPHVQPELHPGLKP